LLFKGFVSQCKSIGFFVGLIEIGCSFKALGGDADSFLVKEKLSV